MRPFARLARIAALALALAGCGGSHATSHKAVKPQGTRLSANNIPDVLMPGIWPNARLRAYRDGNSVTVYTDWSDGETTVGGRSVSDAATVICGQVVNDLQDSSLTVEVLAENGWEHLAFKQDTGTCHSG